MATARCKSRSAPRRRPIASTKPEAGHFAKTKVEPGQGLWEFRLADGEGADLKPGAELKVDLFKVGQYVDVAGTEGKGYSGVIKRHNFSHQYISHGNSLSHRAPGAIGQRQTPGRVFPGQAHGGPPRRRGREHDQPRGRHVDAERNVLLVKGAVPGAENGRVVVSRPRRASPCAEDHAEGRREGRQGR